MMPQDDSHVTETPVFLEDCSIHSFPEEDKRCVKTALALNPEYGRKINFIKQKNIKMECAELRIMNWTYIRNGKIVKANILYIYVPQILPIYLLRLDIDDARDRAGPFDNPQSWPHWAEIVGELTEIILRHVA
jgi:hypothetical protein